VRLTEAGAAFLARVAPALDELTIAEDELADHAARPFGTLRLTVPRIASIALESVLPGFLAAYPDVRVSVTVQDVFVDIVAAGYDAGVRLGESIERDMVATPLGRPQEAALVAAPSYLKRNGTPRTVADLTRHSCINHRLGSGEIYRWELVHDDKPLRVEVSGQLTVDDPALAVAAAIGGVGIAFTFKSYVKQALASGTLVRVLAGSSPVFPGFHLYYPTRRLLPAKLRAFVDYLHAKRS
jgi:DNA-binding transcriptional LysR family regulator